MDAKKSLHIAFVCDTFLTDWSGVERVLAQLAAELMRRGHRCAILAQRPRGPVSPKIPLTPVPEGCGVLQIDWDSDEGLRQGRQDIAQADFDVLAAPCSGRRFQKVPWLLAGSGVPLVDAECVHPAVLTYERWHPYERWAAAAACDCIQLLLAPYRDFFPAPLQGCIAVAGNPAPPPAEVDFAARAGRARRTLLSVGRMVERDKQYSLLLRTWHLLAPDFPDWDLVLVGDGPDFTLHQALAQAMGPQARITLTGAVADPTPYYAGADLFCMPSRQEGFPLVLGEAAAHALPLVALETCDAAKALIAPDMGALAANSSPNALAEALRPLMAAPPAARQAKGLAAQAFFRDTYGGSRAYDDWEALLTGAARCKGHTRLDALEKARWDEALLNQAAQELTARIRPLDETGEDTGVASALARLRSQYDALTREHAALQKRYDSLVRQTQGGGRRR